MSLSQMYLITRVGTPNNTPPGAGSRRDRTRTAALSTALISILILLFDGFTRGWLEMIRVFLRQSMMPSFIPSHFIFLLSWMSFFQPSKSEDVNVRG